MRRMVDSELADRREPSTQTKIVRKPAATCELVHTQQKIDRAVTTPVATEPCKKSVLRLAAERLVSISLMPKASAVRQPILEAPGRLHCTVGSFDDFCGAGEQRRRDLDAYRPCCLLVDDQGELGWLVGRRLTGL